MKWIRFSIDTHVDAVDILSCELNDIGVCGIEIEDNIPLSEEDKNKMFVDILPDPKFNDGSAKVHFYMEPENCNPEKIILQVEEILGRIKEFVEIGKGSISLSETEDKDWINNWKNYFKPFRASEKIVIKPTWEDYSLENADDILIEIDPGIAFGTGSHETTKLCIQALEKHLVEGDSIFDVGCGSGILSIAGLKLGASHAVAMDIDEIAVNVCKENFEVNKLNPDKYNIFSGNLLEDKKPNEKTGQNHDIVVANILADVIIPLTGIISPFLKKGGLFITSGIIASKENDVKKALEDNSFEILEINKMKDWRCFVAKK